jgi:hypothetical protein
MPLAPDRPAIPGADLVTALGPVRAVAEPIDPGHSAKHCHVPGVFSAARVTRLAGPQYALGIDH